MRSRHPLSPPAVTAIAALLAGAVLAAPAATAAPPAPPTPPARSTTPAPPATPVPPTPPARSLEPQLVTRVDTSAGGTGARVLLGDVTGDGRLDMVLMQPDYSANDLYVGHQVQALTAYDLGTGALLWQIGTPDPRVTNNGTDIPAEIYDLDGDGDNEVLAMMGGRFQVFEGATGTAVR